MSKGKSASAKAKGKAYEDFDKTVHDTVIVLRNGKYSIETTGDRNLDEDFGQIREMNHSKLLDAKVNSTSRDASRFEKEIYDGISLNDVMDYLKKHFNWKPNGR